MTSQNFASKSGSLESFKDTRQMRFDFVVAPDPLHGDLGDAQRAGHRARQVQHARPCGGRVA
jgi:hypothetical protein